MKVIVCGTRRPDPSHRSIVEKTLGRFPKIAEVIEGGATGIDDTAHEVAKQNDIDVTTVDADWAGLGPKAGPMRNEQMASMGASMCIAFPRRGPRKESAGTWDMIERAAGRGIPVVIVPVP